MSHLASDGPLLKRVRRLAGQIGAVERALVAGEDCAVTLHLVAAVRGAVNGLLDEIVESHLREHVANPDLTDAERAAGTEQLITAIRRYSK